MSDYSLRCCDRPESLGFPIKLKFKQVTVQTLLSVLRGFIYLKQHTGSIAQSVFGPVVLVGRFLMCTVGVPLYRFSFWIRRHFSRVYVPAKNRALYLVSNRYAIHFAVVAIAAITSSMNVQASEVRAEGYGEKSILYRLVSQDAYSVVEEVSAEEVVEINPSNYIDGFVVSIDDHIDLDYADSGYVTPLVGDAALVARPISENNGSVAPRTEVETYAVQEGDTLSTIAESYGLSLGSVLWANSLSYRSTIRPGQELKVPPTDGVLHTVKSGDTLGKIAKYYAADSEQILAFNKLADGDDLTVGETLMVPGGEPPAPVVRTAPLSSIFTGASGAGSSGATSSGSATGSGTWVWPTDGRVITQRYGWGHTGLDVDCAGFTATNYATNSGTIIYAGWRNGYGMTVEIDHGGGVMTRSGHFSSIAVAAGDYVAAGQALGTCGTTGRSTGTHIHFEVIIDGKFQNPLNFIR